MFRCTSNYIGDRICASEKSIITSLQRLEGLNLIETTIKLDGRYVRLNYDRLEQIDDLNYSIDKTNLKPLQVKKKLKQMLITEGSSVSYCSSFSNETEGSSVNYNNNYNNVCSDADEYDWVDEIDTNFEEYFRPFASIIDKQQ